MKKLLFGILTILGIGLSFCSADVSCVNSSILASNWDTNGYKFGTTLSISNQGNYVVSSFTIKGKRSVPSTATLNICLSSTNNGFLEVSDDGVCYPVSFSTSIDYDVETTTFNLSTPFTFSSNGYSYIFIYIIDDTEFFSSFYRNGESSVIDSNLTYDYTNCNRACWIIKNICYSYDTGITPPKFKVNYGNTSYEYELEDNLFIHLKSPTIQNGNTFSYVGSTGINLFYNGTSQFYNKSNLYLESMYWYNNNIFTPICL